ncbi:NUDIX hydrolase [Candidatus Nomurabacteria bacterium]|nr:NUDIX hydrolase [Candidatus Nomurabacteria bacterium]
MNQSLGDSELPTPGQQVITACAFIHQQIDGEHKVFMAKRSDKKKFLPSVYELPGGHIDFGEEVPTGLVREIQEEFDMTVKLGDPFAVFTYSNEVKGSHSIEVIYFAQFTDEVENIKMNPDDHSTYGWFSELELPQTFVSSKDADDDEVKAIYRGFALLNGESLQF